MELPQRKRLRLEQYDYSKNGMYFVTICAQGKMAIFRESMSDTMTAVGLVVDRELKKLDAVYQNVRVMKYAIMPDHLHLIIYIDDISNQNNVTLSRIIKQFKGSITKKIGYSIWQKSFYDRIIRNEQDYKETWEYIDHNLLKAQLLRNGSL